MSDKWISVDVDLPERPTQKVIVYITRCDYLPPYLDLGQYRDGKWVIDNPTSITRVTHWQPLPEAP